MTEFLFQALLYLLRAAFEAFMEFLAAWALVVTLAIGASYCAWTGSWWPAAGCALGALGVWLTWCTR